MVDWFVYLDPQTALANTPESRAQERSFTYPLLEAAADLSAEKPESISLSISDIEPQSQKEGLGEEELISSIKGVSGHTITTIAHDALHQVRRFGKLTQLMSSDLSIGDNQRKILNEVHFDDGWHTDLELEQVIPFTRELWQGLRTRMSFVKHRPNSKRIPLLEGWQYSSENIRDLWNSQGVASFEEDLFSLLNARVKKYAREDGDHDRWMYLPIETDPRFSVFSEKLYVTHIFLPPFSFQIKARADCVIVGQNGTICIDHKFGNPRKLGDLASRAQALLYSYLSQNGREISFTRIQDIKSKVHGFLYHSYDLYRKEDIYIDPEVNLDPDFEALGYLKDRLYEIMFQEKEFRAIRKRRSTAVVMPHLPTTQEESTAFQPRLF